MREDIYKAIQEEFKKLNIEVGEDIWQNDYDERLLLDKIWKLVAPNE